MKKAGIIALAGILIAYNDDNGSGQENANLKDCLRDINEAITDST